MKTIEELKKFYKEKAAALKKQKEEAIKKAEAKAAKVEAAERAVLRKSDSHIKIIIGGYVLSEIKAGRMEVDFLSKVADSIKGNKDKKLIISLASFFQQSLKKLKK